MRFVQYKVNSHFLLYVLYHSTIYRNSQIYRNSSIDVSFKITHTRIHSIYEEVVEDSRERSSCAHMPARFRSQKGVFRGETVVSYNPWRHIIYIKLADKFSLARWPYPRRAGTFEGISLIGHKIGTEDPLTSCAGRMAHKAP